MSVTAAICSIRVIFAGDLASADVQLNPRESHRSRQSLVYRCVALGVRCPPRHGPGGVRMAASAPPWER